MIVPDAVLEAAQAGEANGQEEEKLKRRKRRRLPRLALDAKRLAPALSISLRGLRTLDAAGKFPAGIKLGSRKIWFLPEIRAWLQAGAPDRRQWEAMKRSK
jgi:hypothetical protein